MLLKKWPILYIALIFTFAQCKSKTNSSKAEKDNTTAVPRVVATPEVPGLQKAPIINIVDTTSDKQIFIYVKDTAASTAEISTALSEIYGSILPAIIKTYKLKVTGPPIALYKSLTAPYYFEAGFPIAQKPVKNIKGAMVKTIEGGKVVVAHFFGPYDITHMAYEAVDDYLKANKKKKLGQPYEIYIGDPMDKQNKKIDPYKVQTDIVFPYVNN